MALMGAGFVALFKKTQDSAVLCFLPGILNILVVVLMVLGLLSVEVGGPTMILLGLCTLLLWCAVALLMLVRMKRNLRLGAYLWCAACVLLAIDAIARGCWH